MTSTRGWTRLELALSLALVLCVGAQAVLYHRTQRLRTSVGNDHLALRASLERASEAFQAEVRSFRDEQARLSQRLEEQAASFNAEVRDFRLTASASLGPTAETLRDHEVRLRGLQKRMLSLDTVGEDVRSEANNLLRETARGALNSLATARMIMAREVEALRSGQTGHHPPLPKEVGVVNDEYIYGDVRRYGVFPDCKTNWGLEGYNDILVANASTLGIEIVFPGGCYRSNLAIDASNVTFRFEPGAEFAGTVHINSKPYMDVADKPIYNVRLVGTLVLYDRFGTINVHGLSADHIVIKSDPFMHLSGQNNRGAHIYFGSRYFDIKSLTVEKGESAETLNMHAAVSIDGGGNNPRDIKIDYLWVKDARVHGVYVTGAGHAFKSIRVDGYCDGPPIQGIQDATPEEARQCKAVWFNRASATVDEVIVTQKPDGETDRSSEVFAVAFSREEVRWSAPWTTPIFAPRGVHVGTIRVTNPRKHAVGFGPAPSHAQIGLIEATGHFLDQMAVVGSDPSAQIEAVAINSHSPVPIPALVSVH